MTLPKYILLGFVILLLCLIVIYQMQISWLKKSLKEANAQSEDCLVLIDQQNRAIEAWRRQANTLTDKAKKAEQEAEKMRQQHQAKAHKIMNTAVPQDCEGAMNWLIEQANSYNP